jgi:hypothetical protein
MIARTLTLAGGLSGALGLSQFPEFSQQYAQRLGGAVDELRLFVAEFDADAASVGLSREAALRDLANGGALGAARADSMQGTIARKDRLEAALGALQDAGPFTRAYHVLQFNDREIARAAFSDFKPAVPLTFEGAVFSGAGFLGGFLGIAMVFGLLRRLFRRRAADGAA